MNKAERIDYYDNLLQENTDRVLNGLPPTEEYRRLDALTEICMARIEAADTHNDDGVVEVENEVIDFVDAFERLLGSELLTVH